MNAGDCTTYDTGVPLGSIHGNPSSLDQPCMHALCSKYTIIELIGWEKLRPHLPVAHPLADHPSLFLSVRLLPLFARSQLLDSLFHIIDISVISAIVALPRNSAITYSPPVPLYPPITLDGFGDTGGEMAALDLHIIT